MKAIIETQSEYKKGKLLYSFNAKDKEDAEQKISKEVYYTSSKTLTMYSLNRGIKYFYLVNAKGEINRNVIITNKENSSKFQLRQFIN